jgi:hypothetical protein
MTFLSVEGVKALSSLVPMFQNNILNSYWKSANINLLIVRSAFFAPLLFPLYVGGGIKGGGKNKKKK